MSAPVKARPPRDYVIGKTEDIKTKYDIGKQIGLPGQFGYAVRATHKATGEVRAVKVVSKARFAQSKDREFHFSQLAAEIEVMRELNHPNIIRYYEFFESETELFIVMELCQGGELFDRIKEKNTYSEHEAATAVRQIFQGLAYMHSKKIAHCDLKPDNFLYMDKSDAKLKIIDFGMAKHVRRRHHFKSLCGTPYYMAPEVILAQYNEHADMWSMGVVLFVMLFGYPPFYADPEKHKSKTDDAIFELIKKGFKPVVQEGFGAHFPSSIPVSESARDLMARLLTRDVAKRLTSEEALNHPWVKGETALKTPLNASMLKNLKNFNGITKVKQKLLGTMAGIVSDSEIRELKKTFVAIDKNGDGCITLDELKEAMSKVGDGSTSEQLLSIFKAADVDGSGSISYEELLLPLVHAKLRAKEERLWDAFRKIDANGDGILSPEEIDRVLGQGAAKEFMAEADTNKDGKVSIDEFLDYWWGTNTAAAEKSLA